MNTHTRPSTAIPAGISPEEWQARTDLAAAYRLIAHYGWGDVIYNHSSMRVPGEDRKFLIKRHELLYTEVTASNLVKVDMDADLDESAGVNRPGFTLHGGVLASRADVNCAVHVHTELGMAISGLKSGLRMVSQAAIRFYNRIGYHVYEGITEDFSERARINAALGSNRALILHNHGLLTVGATVREGNHVSRLANSRPSCTISRRRAEQWRSHPEPHGRVRNNNTAAKGNPTCQIDDGACASGAGHSHDFRYVCVR